MATIVSAVGAAGSWTVGSAWIGGVAPTAADDAQIPLATTSITIDTGAVARSVDFSTFTGTITHNSGATLTIGDATAGLSDVALVLAGTYNLGSATTSAISFVSTSTTQQTINFNTKTHGNLTFNGAGGSWIFNDASTSTGGATTHSAGTLNTNGQTISWGSLDMNNAGTRTATWGSSSITLTAAGSGTFLFRSSNLTITANTAVFTLTGASARFSVVTAAANLNGASMVMSGSGAAYIVPTLQTITLANFTRTGTAVKTDSFIIDSNGSLVVTGTLRLDGNSVTNRLLVSAVTLGTAHTITAATMSASTDNVDFRDITGAGAANWDLSAKSSGDIGGNSNITFTTSATQTSTGTASFTWSTHGWTSRVPLPQDDVVVGNAFVSGRTITIDMPRLGRSLDFSGVTSAGTVATISQSVAVTIYGSLTLPGTSALTYSNNNGTTFAGRSAYDILSTGQTFNSSLGINITAPNGTYRLLDDLISLGTITLNNGTFNANNKNVTTTTFIGSVTTTRALTMGSGTWTLTGTGTVWTTTTITGLTFNANTSTIKITSTSATARTFAGGGLTYNNFWSDAGASTASLTISGSNTFADFKDTGTAAHSILFTAGTTQTVTTFTVSGSSGNVITINSNTTATHALVKAGGGTISSDYLNIQHSVATPANTWYAGANSTDNQAVGIAGSGWIFTTLPGGNIGNMFLMFQ